MGSEFWFYSPNISPTSSLFPFPLPFRFHFLVLPPLSLHPKQYDTVRKKRETYLQVLICGLLVLLVHRPGGSLGKHPDRHEHRERHPDTEHRVSCYLPALAWRGKGTGAVGTERNVVCYMPHSLAIHLSPLNISPSRAPPFLCCLLYNKDGVPSQVGVDGEIQGKRRRESHTSLLLLQRQLSPVRLHPIPQRHPQIRLLLRRHALPSLLDVRQGRVGDGVRLSLLNGSYERCSGSGSSAQQAGSQHHG